jgi:hypothetical protein
MNTTYQLKGTFKMNHRFTLFAGVLRGFIVVAFLAIGLLPVVLSATAAVIA